MLIAAGVSHRTARIDDRERVSLQRDEIPRLLERYRELYGNGVVLATCNRTEVYVHTGQRGVEVPAQELVAELAAFKGLDFPTDVPAFYCLEGPEVPRHLFSVASGVDSMILGESQILGQVREALSDAADAQTLDAALARLLHEALRTGKRARTETSIGRYAVSVSSAAVDLAREHVPSLPDCRALVVGAGDAGLLAARALRDRGIQHLTVTSRTRERAQGVADVLDATTVPFDQLVPAVAAADLVITSSSAASFLIDRDIVDRARAIRDVPLTFIDVAVPRDVDPVVSELANVRVFDLDDLQGRSAANLRLRKDASEDVCDIVDTAVVAYDEWLDGRCAAPTIKAIVQRATDVREAEVQRTARDLGLDAAGSDKLDKMSAAIVKKLLHEPLLYLRDADDTESAAELLRRVFGVEDD
jgi:glutamyl-tRNA reductase